MPRTEHRIRMIAALVGIVILILAVGCHGFFTNPVLQSITVSPPTPSVAQGGTQQMTAIGNFDDGSTSTLTSGVSWNSSDNTVATVSTSGLVTGVAVGKATVTATSGSATGNTQVSVTAGTLTRITVTPAIATLSSSLGGSQSFTATGTFQNGNTSDITDSVTWQSSSLAVTINNKGSASVTVGATPQTVTITAVSGSITGTATLTITQ
jgi:hypothetical protein